MRDLLSQIEQVKNYPATSRSAGISVRGYLERLEREAPALHQAVCEMDVHAFADSLSDARRLREENRLLRQRLQTLRQMLPLSPPSNQPRYPVSQDIHLPPNRERLTNQQKDAVKRSVVAALAAGSKREGLSRSEIVAWVARHGDLHGVPAARLSEKLRIPLQELQEEGVLGTCGERRFLRYLLLVQRAEAQGSTQHP